MNILCVDRCHDKGRTPAAELVVILGYGARGLLGAREALGQCEGISQDLNNLRVVGNTRHGGAH